MNPALARAGTAGLPPSTEPWTLDHARELYRVEAWGDVFFAINGLGHAAVRPLGTDEVTIDLTKVVAALERQGVPVPFLIRFQDILRQRVQQISGAFSAAIADAPYDGRYCPVYPIKVNQLHEVVEEVLDAGKAVGLGLECGSKAELIAALPLINDTERLLICNGVKDEAMLTLILSAQQLGQRVIPVMERYSEFLEFLRLAEQLGVTPRLGVRVRLATRGSGRWGDSTGTRSKFGLTVSEVLRLAGELKNRGMHDALELIHFHPGSQIADIQVLRQAVKEIGQIYAALRKRELIIRYVDVGGGLGVTYDVGATGDDNLNYGLREYANAIVLGLKEVCVQQGVPEPDLVTESGRALTAHHSVLIVPVLGAVSREDLRASFAPEVLEQPRVAELAKIYEHLRDGATVEHLLEAIHDSKEIRGDLHTLFGLGYLDIDSLAAADELYWAIARVVLAGLQNLEWNPPPDELVELEEGLTDQYLCDFSVFQSILDHWAIDQSFPIMPIDRLDERPGRRARLVDLTCDSDGRVSHYVSALADKSFLPVQELEEGTPYYLGFFLMGAYQDILGDAHNLFGRVAEAHVYADAGEPDNFWVEKVIPGAAVQDMLAQVQYFPNDLQRRMEELVRARISDGVVRASQGSEILARYRACFAETTYYKPSGSKAVSG